MGAWLLAAAVTLLAAPVVVLILRAAGLGPEDIGVALIPLSPLVTGLVALGVAAAIKGGSIRMLFGRGRPGFFGVVGAVLLGAAAFFVFNLLFSALIVSVLHLIGIEPPEVQESLRDAADRPDALPMLAFSTTLVAPLGEELLYRGLLFQALLNRFRPAAAIWLSALAFGIGHVAIGAPALSNVVLAILIVPLGALLAWTFLRWGTLWIPIVIHAVFNLITVWLMTAGIA